MKIYVLVLPWIKVLFKPTTSKLFDLYDDDVQQIKIKKGLHGVVDLFFSHGIPTIESKIIF
jgi:hypothetical protein